MYKHYVECFQQLLLHSPVSQYDSAAQHGAAYTCSMKMVNSAGECWECAELLRNTAVPSTLQPMACYKCCVHVVIFASLTSLRNGLLKQCRIYRVTMAAGMLMTAPQLATVLPMPPIGCQQNFQHAPRALQLSSYHNDLQPNYTLHPHGTP